MVRSCPNLPVRFIFGFVFCNLCIRQVQKIAARRRSVGLEIADHLLQKPKRPSANEPSEASMSAAVAGAAEVGTAALPVDDKSSSKSSPSDREQGHKTITKPPKQEDSDASASLGTDDGSVASSWSADESSSRGDGKGSGSSADSDSGSSDGSENTASSEDDIDNEARLALSVEDELAAEQHRLEAEDKKEHDAAMAEMAR